MRTVLSLFCLLATLISTSQDLTVNAERAFSDADYEDAFHLFKEASEKYIRQDEPVAYVQCNLRMAECKVLMGEPSQGNQIAANTIDYLDKYFPQQGLVKGEALTLQGRAYLNLGRNDLALEYLKKAETLFGSEETLELATCMNDLGVAYLNNGNYELSLQYLDRSLSVRQQFLSSTDLPIGDSFNNLGYYHQETDNPLQALIYFNRAKKIYEKNLGPNHPKTALVINNLAFAYSNQEDYDEALKLLQVVQNNLNSKIDGNHERKAFVLLSIGRVQFQQGKPNQAIATLNEALRMYISLFGPKHPEVANTYYLIGEVTKSQEEYRYSVENFQKAIYANLLNQEYQSVYDLPETRDYFNADYLLSALEGKAVALEALHYRKTLNTKDLTYAVKAYEKCDELISVIRQIRQNEGDKIKLGEISKRVYENGIRLSLTLSEQTLQKRIYQEKAFQFCERSKSAVLLEAINETKAKSFAGIPRELIDLEDSLKAEIAFFEQQLASGQDQEKFKNLLFTYQSAYQEFIKNLETNFPSYFELKYSQSLTSLDKLQASLDDGTTMLSYFLGTNQLYIFQVDRKALKALVLQKDSTLESNVITLRNAIKYKLDDKVISSATELYDRLMPKKLGTPHKIIILPDGILGTLPFEALIESPNASTHIADQNFLIKQVSISYDYSATLWVNRKSTYEYENEKVLLCAPISFDNNEIQMSELPDSKQEVREIKLFFLANGGAEMVLNKEASEELLKSDAILGYKYLHFATHGQVNESKPELSRVFLAPSQSEDGSLYAGEIYNLKVKADLVTLSACETGLGKIAKGEGIVGLSRAFQYAGANNLIVSLWQVADKSTSDLMIKFYDYQLHNDYPGYSMALRQAKLYLLRSGDYGHPYYWAPFILVGQ